MFLLQSARAKEEKDKGKKGKKGKGKQEPVKKPPTQKQPQKPHNTENLTKKPAQTGGEKGEEEKPIREEGGPAEEDKVEENMITIIKIQMSTCHKHHAYLWTFIYGIKKTKTNVKITAYSVIVVNICHNLK